MSFLDSHGRYLQTPIRFSNRECWLIRLDSQDQRTQEYIRRIAAPRTKYQITYDNDDSQPHDNEYTIELHENGGRTAWLWARTIGVYTLIKLFAFSEERDVIDLYQILEKLLSDYYLYIDKIKPIPDPMYFVNLDNDMVLRRLLAPVYKAHPESIIPARQFNPRGPAYSDVGGRHPASIEPDLPDPNRFMCIIYIIKSEGEPDHDDYFAPRRPLTRFNSELSARADATAKRLIDATDEELDDLGLSSTPSYDELEDLSTRFKETTVIDPPSRRDLYALTVQSNLRARPSGGSTSFWPNYVIGSEFLPKVRDMEYQFNTEEIAALKSSVNSDLPDWLKADISARLKALTSSLDSAEEALLTLMCIDSNIEQSQQTITADSAKSVIDYEYDSFNGYCLVIPDMAEVLQARGKKQIQPSSERPNLLNRMLYSDSDGVIYWDQSWATNEVVAAAPRNPDPVVPTTVPMSVFQFDEQTRTNNLLHLLEQALTNLNAKQVDSVFESIYNRHKLAQKSNIIQAKTNSRRRFRRGIVQIDGI